MVFASSAPPPRDLPDACDYLPLPLDAPARDADGHDAHGHLHWAPRHHEGLLARHRFLLDAVASHRPSMAMVDVSVEIAVTLRVSGVPVTAVRLPGTRDDPPHQLGFGLADQVVMPVPATWGLHDGLPCTHAVGLVTAAREPLPPTANGRPTAVVVVGTGGSRLDRAACELIAGDLPGHDVIALGPQGVPGLPNLTFTGRVADTAPYLGRATVVIGNTGLGTLGEVVAARRPFVTLPEDRPFGEQAVTARQLDEHGEAVVLHRMPGPGGWAEAVAKAQALGAPQAQADGASRLARLIEENLMAVAR